MSRYMISCAFPILDKSPVRHMLMCVSWMRLVLKHLFFGRQSVWCLVIWVMVWGSGWQVSAIAPSRGKSKSPATTSLRLGVAGPSTTPVTCYIWTNLIVVVDLHLFRSCHRLSCSTMSMWSGFDSFPMDDIGKRTTSKGRSLARRSWKGLPIRSTLRWFVCGLVKAHTDTVFVLE